MLDAFLPIPTADKNAASSQKYITCTIHRAGDITDRKNLSEIISTINDIQKTMEVIIPLHPHAENRIKEFGLQLKCTVIAPLGYPAMKRFLSDARYVLTDNGGTCREAFFSGKLSLSILIVRVLLNLFQIKIYLVMVKQESKLRTILIC